MRTLIPRDVVHPYCFIRVLLFAKYTHHTCIHILDAEVQKPVKCSCGSFQSILKSPTDFFFCYMGYACGCGSCRGCTSEYCTHVSSTLVNNNMQFTKSLFYIFTVINKLLFLLKVCNIKGWSNYVMESWCGVIIRNFF